MPSLAAYRRHPACTLGSRTTAGWKPAVRHAHASGSAGASPSLFSRSLSRADAPGSSGAVGSARIVSTRGH